MYHLPMRIFLSSLLFISLSFSLSAQDKAKGKGKGGPPQNVKVLDPTSDIRATMQTFTAGLGVMCTFCHVQGDFPSDANPKKEMARMMITMAKDINAKFPDGKVHVTCFTCHRGANEPLTAPPQ
jgi:hypothetical protein